MNKSWELRHELRPGDIGYLTYIHGILYNREYGFDITFEASLAQMLAKFGLTCNPGMERIWLAESDNQIVGSIAIVMASKTEAQLRWYLVHPDFRGQGLGKILFTEALNFCKEHEYKSVFLWTASELTTAAYLYTRAGFVKTQVKSHHIWGKFVSEERYELQLQKLDGKK
jgi:N-acetylglutamate synthase-like GNAT family acetyltransferase